MCVCVCVCVCVYVYVALLVSGQISRGREAEATDFILWPKHHPSDPICLTLPELQSLPDVAWGSTIVRAMPFGRAGPFGFPAFGVRATGYLAVPMANKQRLRDLSEPCTSWLEGFLTYVSVASPTNRRTHERRHHRTKNRTSAVRRRSPSTRYSNDATGNRPEFDDRN